MSAVMKRPVLVLNKSWQAINVLSMMDAITKIWVGSAKIVDPEDFQMYEWEDWTNIIPKAGDKVIRGGQIEIRAPEVIVLTVYDKTPNTGVTFNRRNIYARDNFTCQYCTKKLHNSEVTLDHIVPRAQGGISSWTNCVVSCVPCNSKKADRTPEQAGMKLLSVPKKPKWTPTLKRENVLSSWEKFVSGMYWNVPLED